jgi:glycosyltransferase involved in cell wall biosynthesis
MDYAAPYLGNFMKSILRLEKEIENNGGKMVYVFMRYSERMTWVDELSAGGAVVYFLSGKLADDFLQMRKIIKKHDIKIINTHFTTPKFLLLLKFYYPNITIISHCLNHLRPRRKSFRTYIKKMISHYDVDVVIGCSESVALSFSSQNTNKKIKVTCVTSAVDFPRLDTFEVLDKTKLGIPQQSIVFFMLGFDFYRKGVDLTIKAFEQLRKDGYDIALLISLAANHAYVTAEIKKYLGEMPDWLKIVDARDDIATYYKLADTFISASREEGFCYALVEAAYCGNQLIASDESGQAQLKIPYTFEFESGNIDAFVSQIKRSLETTPDDREQRKIVQKEYVIKKYDLDTWAKEICRVYQSS